MENCIVAGWQQLHESPFIPRRKETISFLGKKNLFSKLRVCVGRWFTRRWRKRFRAATISCEIVWTGRDLGEGTLLAYPATTQWACQTRSSDNGISLSAGHRAENGSMKADDVDCRYFRPPRQGRYCRNWSTPHHHSFAKRCNGIWNRLSFRERLIGDLIFNFRTRQAILFRSNSKIRILRNLVRWEEQRKEEEKWDRHGA